MRSGSAVFGSKEEEYLYRALSKAQIQFYYQFPIYGGRRLRGGLVVDFVLLPFFQPVEVYGEYWHSGQLGADDRLKQALERQYFKKDVILVWGSELPDQAAADMLVKVRFM